MNVRRLLLALSFLVSFAMYGCGSGGEGLNGAITVTASATGSVINATATYSNPTHANLIGVPITFSVQIGPDTFSLGTFNTNNSGSVSVSFTPPTFSGTQTITVIASSDNLTNFASVSLTGRSLIVTPPPQMALTSTAAAGTAVTVAILPTTNFITVTDPFTTDLSGITFAITQAFVSTATNDTVTLTSPSTTTNTVGVAGFPGATVIMHVPAAVGGVDTLTITWTVTDIVTGLTGTGTTTITLTKTA